MKYCSLTTQSHPLSQSYPQCIEDINLLLVNEGFSGANKLFGNGETVLNMDLAEELQAVTEGNRAKNMSMDLAFGISDTGLVNKLMVLAELKLNSNNPNNITKEELEGKVNGSILLLKNSIPILANYYFVFQDGKVHEARSRLFRIRPRIPNEYFAIVLSDLYSYFF